MAESHWSTELAKLGYNAQQRFNAFAVALCFTILGLAIETATFGTNAAADFLEIVGWISLLVAGVAGFHGLEWDPQIFQLMGLQAGQERRLTSLREARARGTKTVRALDSQTDLDISGLIVRDERDLDTINNRIKEISEKSRTGYRIRSVAFLVGLVALMVARALEPVLGMFSP
jgi:hypothetical protein